MALHCEKHEAFLYDRGGIRRLGSLGNIDRVQWERLRDEISSANVRITARSPECDTTLGLAAAGRSELVIYRGGIRVWEGPVTHIAYRGDGVTITARDVGHYIYRTIMKSGYDNRYPRISKVTTRIHRILMDELVRMEAQSPPINVRPHIVLHERSTDARTSSRTYPYQMTVYEHMDTMAARGGLDYTVIGRALHLWDTHDALGTTGIVTEADFMGEVVITEYGMELATISVITDGKGRAGVAGKADPFYGLVEVLDTAYDESSGEDWDEATPQPDPPSVKEMKTQAAKILAGRNPTPVVVRVPDNSTLNPNGILTIEDLVPGVFIPLRADLPGRSLSQMQKLDRMTVEETKDGEIINVVMSPAPDPNSNAED